MLSSRHSGLCCMLTDMNAKLGATNQMDVFLFTVGNAAQTIYDQSPCANRKMNITVVFMALDQHWGADPKHSSSAIHDRNGWIPQAAFGEKYRRMGHWRLTFQLAFADILGYKGLLLRSSATHHE
jgi:hypothetical protein